jgi:hypothetical protein
MASRDTTDGPVQQGLSRVLAGIGLPRHSPLVRFHVGRGRDAAGRRHHEVIALDDDHLEWTYDWTQWTFPLYEPSELCPQAPVLTDEDLAILWRSDEACSRMAAARARMTEFLGDGSRWLRKSDYNHFRITRAIRSTRLVLGDQYANDFRRAVFELMMARPHRVGAEALSFWRAA